MRKVDRLILQEVAGPFFGSLCLFTALFFAAGEMRIYLEFLQNGESIAAVGQVILYSFPYILAFTAPMAMLLATLLGFGRLSGDSETVALTAAGVSFVRTLLPVAGFAAAVAIPIYFANTTIIPRANQARQAIIDNVKKKGGTALSTRNAVTLTTDAGGGATLFVYARGGVAFGDHPPDRPPEAILRHVAISLWRDGKLLRIVYADRARWLVDTRNWRLEGDLWGFDRNQSGGTYQTADDVTTRDYALGRPQQLSVLARPENERTSSELRTRARLRRAEGNETEARRAETEVARREAMPLAALVFALVGAPLGNQPRRGGKGVGFGLSVLVTFAYWTLTQICQAVGLGGGLPIPVAAHLPNLVGFAASAYLAWQASR